MKTAIVIPAYNCEKSLPKALDGLANEVDEIIVIVDGGSDNSEEVARSLGATVLVHPVNRGLGAALRTGFEYALKNNYDIIVTFDADGQHDRRGIDTVIKKIEDTECDIVIGSRLMDNSQHHKFPPLRLFGNLLLTWLANLAVGYHITSDSQSGYRGFHRAALETLRLKEDRMCISSEIILEAARNKCKVLDVPITATYEDEISTQRFFIDPPAIAILTIKYFLRRLFIEWNWVVKSPTVPHAASVSERVEDVQ